MTGSSVVESAASDIQGELSENEPPRPTATILDEPTSTGSSPLGTPTGGLLTNSSFFSISSINPEKVDVDEFRNMQAAIVEMQRELRELKEENEKLVEKVEQIRLPGPQTSDQCLLTDEAEEYEGDDCVTPLPSITSKAPHDKHDWPKPVIFSINTPLDEKGHSISLQNQCSSTRPPGYNVRILKIYEKKICQLQEKISCIDKQDSEQKNSELQKQKQIHEKELESLINNQHQEIERQEKSKYTFLAQMEQIDKLLINLKTKIKDNQKKLRWVEAKKMSYFSCFFSPYGFHLKNEIELKKAKYKFLDDLQHELKRHTIQSTSENGLCFTCNSDESREAVLNSVLIKHKDQLGMITSGLMSSKTYNLMKQFNYDNNAAMTVGCWR